MRYSVLYYFGDNIKSNWHSGFLDVYNFRIYLIKDDKNSFALDNVIDCYLIDIPRYNNCIKLYFNNCILNFLIVNTYFFKLISSPNLVITDKIYKQIVRKNRIGVYKKYVY